MIPIYSKCYVENEGIGIIEAVCNDKPKGGFKFSYCIRLKKSPQKLNWFEQHEVNAYNGPDEEENQDQAKNPSDSQKEAQHKSKRT